MKDLKGMKLSEMRKLYPNIKTNSKKKFIQMVADLEPPTDLTTAIIDAPTMAGSPEIVGGNLPGNDAESIAEARHVMQIRENVPKPLLDELYVLQGCECTADAYAKFRDTPFPVTRAMQHALNHTYYEFFKERLRSTSCSSCIARRVQRIREHLATKIQ